jgi:hypothetical protein
MADQMSGLIREISCETCEIARWSNLLARCYTNQFEDQF